MKCLVPTYRWTIFGGGDRIWFSFPSLPNTTTVSLCKNKHIWILISDHYLTFIPHAVDKVLFEHSLNNIVAYFINSNFNKIETLGVLQQKSTEFLHNRNITLELFHESLINWQSHFTPFFCWLQNFIKHWMA